MRHATVLALALLLFSCGGENPSGDAGPPVDAADPPVADAGPPAEAFEGTPDAWTYVEVDGARCGNGSPLGIAVSLHPGADRVLVFLQGGGACWDEATCFVVRSASHIEDTLDAATVLAEARQLDGYVANRDPAVGPIADATYVYVPYCTGDLHAGANVATHGTREVHHVGATNAQIILDRLHATVPDPSRVYLAGISAGGYGTMLNFWRARARWPGVRVDALDDSATPVNMVADRWVPAKAAWDLQLPPGCTECEDGLSAVLPFYASTVTDEHRFALMAFTHDMTISTFFGLGLDDHAAQLDAARAAMSASDHQRSFVLTGTQHVVLAGSSPATSGGVTPLAWLQRFFDDAAPFEDAGP